MSDEIFEGISKYVYVFSFWLGMMVLMYVLFF